MTEDECLELSYKKPRKVEPTPSNLEWHTCLICNIEFAEKEGSMIMICGLCMKKEEWLV